MCGNYYAYFLETFINLQIVHVNHLFLVLTTQLEISQLIFRNIGFTIVSHSVTCASSHKAPEADRAVEDRTAG